ncbi:MAG: fibronectin type III domain-containing protein, partial [Verrucomicrobiales bacterium]|nr:fibronectin type III domain-containing protein [Verrucomicrobiales bacterium]
TLESKSVLLMKMNLSGKRMISGAVRSIWMVAVVALFLPAFAEAQLFGRKKKDTPVGLTQDQIGIPTPVTGRVEAIKGMEIQFEIRAETKTPAAAVEFLIRVMPSAGKIISMTEHPTKRNSAIVVYYADPDSSAESDAFAFASRYRGGRYSSEMRYDIDLTEVKSEVSVPKEINFGDVMVGSKVEKEIAVRNLGNGNFERQLVLAPPWSFVDPVGGMLKLGGKELKMVKVAFRPDLMGETSYFLSFSRSKTGTTKLIGNAIDPFRVKAGQVTLFLDEASGKRGGAIELENPGSKPIRLLARASNRLSNSLQQEYFLVPEKTTSIKVGLGKTDTAPFDGMVQFYLENGYTKTVQVVAPVVPGRLEISIPDSITSELINFGKVSAGKSTERVISLVNPGGVAVPLEFHVPEPFRLLTDPGPQLSPMSSVNLSIGLFPSMTAKGSVDATMNIYGNEQTVSLRLLGNVVRSKTAAANTPGNLPPAGAPLKGLRMAATPRSSTAPGEAGGNASQASGTPDSSGTISKSVSSHNYEVEPDPEKAWYEGMSSEMIEAMRSPLGHITMPTVKREYNPDTKKPEDCAVLESAGDSLILAWTAPKNSELFSFAVEVAGLHTGDGFAEPFRVWVPYENVEFDRIDRLIKAEVKGLLPNTTYEFRIFTIDENGRASLPSPMKATTGLPMDWTYIYLVSAIVLVLLLAYSAFRIFKDRQPEVYEAQYLEE